ncbi:MAG: hypothetical protein AAF488_01460 [Planctomycetota bacterium]
MSEVQWRVISSYIGAGRFALRDDRVIVGTEAGVECLPRIKDSGPKWKVDFGSRCIGVQEMSEAGDGDLLATCRSGLLLLSGDGDEELEKLFSEPVVHEALPMGEQLVVATGTTLLLYDGIDGGLEWRYSFLDLLGQSVEAVRLVNLFELGGTHIVAGVVDYDSGVGRVVVLDKDGEVQWESPPGPLSEVFPSGKDRFVWSFTSFPGKFESRCTTTSGDDVFGLDFAGVGTALPDGSVAMVIGTNEAPKWDNWDLRIVAPDGSVTTELTAKGRAPVRPICTPDGSVYFIGYVLHLDPASSRVDYTNFFAMPQELHFQHLVGIRKQIPEYEIYVQRFQPGSETVEVLYHLPGSFSLAQPQLFGSGEVVFCDGPDIVAIS